MLKIVNLNAQVRVILTQSGCDVLTMHGILCDPGPYRTQLWQLMQGTMPAFIAGMVPCFEDNNIEIDTP